MYPYGSTVLLSLIWIFWPLSSNVLFFKDNDLQRAGISIILSLIRVNTGLGCFVVLVDSIDILMLSDHCLYVPEMDLHFLRVWPTTSSLKSTSETECAWTEFSVSTCKFSVSPAATGLDCLCRPADFICLYLPRLCEVVSTKSSLKRFDWPAVLREDLRTSVIFSKCTTTLKYFLCIRVEKSNSIRTPNIMVV